MTFIVGIGRSGTTMLTNMLNSHPEVISTPENEFLLFTQSTFKDKDFSSKKNIDSFLNVFDHNFNKVLSVWRPDPKVREDILNLKEKSYANVCKLVYLNYPFGNKDKQAVKCIVDKNPVYSLYIDKINEVYPKAKYVIIVRDFRDNVLSRKKHTPAGSINDLAVAWNIYYENAVGYLKDKSLNYHILKYEDLVADPSEVLKSLCEFLGVKYSEEMLKFQEVSRQMKEHIKKNSSSETYEKISGMHSHLEEEVSNKRIKAFEKELSEEEIQYLNYTCCKVGSNFNYISTEDIKTIRPRLNWRLANMRASLRFKVYLKLSRIYYMLPVALRLKMLKKQK